MLTKPDLNKLTKEFNDFTDIDRPWDKRLLLDHTGFNSIHNALAGLNSDNTLLEFQTIKTEIKNVLFDKNDSRISLYLKSRFSRRNDKQFLIKLSKDKKKFELTIRREKGDYQLNSLKRQFGNDLSEILPNKYEEFKKFNSDEELEETLIILKHKDVSQREYDLKRDFTNKYYEELINQFDNSGYEQYLKLLNEALGYQVDLVFEFNFMLSINPAFYKKTKNYVEFGVIRNNTYNSLPEMIRLSKVKEVNHVKLSDILIEKAGYYSHDSKMSIRPEQVKQAKDFHKKFIKEQKNMLKKIEKEVKGPK